MSPLSSPLSALAMPAPPHLPPSMLQSVAQLPKNKRLILFTRHSLRESADSNGFASSKLPLTDDGRVLAKAWGHWLATQLDYSMAVDSISSPMPRCIDTAMLMQTGAGIRQEILHQPLLVEPGSFVVEREVAGEIFRQIGALNFINEFLAGNLAGTKTREQGVLDLLALFYQHQPAPGELMLAVSHDTLLAAFLAVLMNASHIEWADWPKMMEGVFLWFDEQPFEKAQVHFIWRGKLYVRPLTTLLSEQQAEPN